MANTFADMLPIVVTGQFVSVANAGALPPATSVPLNSVRITEDNHTLYVNVNNTWEPLATPSGAGGVNNATNLGSGAGVFKDLSVDTLRFRSLTGSGGVAVDGAAPDHINLTLDATTTDIPEGANLYYTSARVTADESVHSVAGRGGDVVLDVNDITSGNTNRLVWLDGSGILSAMGDFAVNTFPGGGLGLDLYSATAPDNTGGFTVHNFHMDLNASVDSPNDTVTLMSRDVTINSDFALGSNGEALDIDRMSINQVGGNGNLGNLVFTNRYFNLGNGTNTFSVKNLAFSYGFADIQAGVTLDGTLQGHTFQANIHTGAITTSNFNVQAWSDFTNASDITIYGYSTLNAGPNIGIIPNNHNYNGISIGANVGELQGNAGYFAYSTYGQITKMGASSNYQAYNAGPHIGEGHGSIAMFETYAQVDSGDANVNMFQGGMGGVHTTGTTSVLNLDGQTADGNMSEASINNVRFNVGGSMTPASNLTVQSNHVIFTSFVIPNATITGTDVLMNVLSPDVDFGPVGGSVSIGPVGLGSAMVAFAGQLHGHGHMDQLSALLPAAIFAQDFSLTEWRNVNAIMLNAGFAGSVTNATAFYHEVVGGLFATNHWGLKIVSDVDNFATKMALGTATKTANALAILDIESTTKGVLMPRMTTTQKLAIVSPPEGLEVMDITLHKKSYFNGTVWVNL